MRESWPSENLILGLLCEQPRHGYELAQLVNSDEALRIIWYLKRSEVYFLLDKLLDKGMIEESGDVTPSAVQTRDPIGGPPRVIYAATPVGRVLFEHWLMTPEKSPRDLRAAFLAKLYLALRREPSVAVRLLTAQREILEDWQERLLVPVSENSFVNMARRLRLRQVQAGLTALDEIRGMLPAPP
jgi:DNA-binding PadR family transcriptional regulator